MTVTPNVERVAGAALAESLRRAHQYRTPIKPLRDQMIGAEIDDAYAIQESNTQAWLAEGRRLVGRKIGLTSKAVQRQLGVDQPDYGMLFADMALLDGEEIGPDRLIQPKAEAEIAFVMERPMAHPDATLPEILGAIAYALPAIEVVDSRIRDWDIGILDTIADNASSGLFALGAEKRKLDEFDLRLCGMVIERNGLPESFGAGAACLGHPLNAVTWLARRMAQIGRPLQPGDIVLSGALGPMITPQPGDRIEARINGLGSLRLSFAGGTA